LIIDKCVLRHGSLLHNVTENKLKRKATRGWKILFLLSELMENKSYSELKHESDGRVT